MKIIVCAVGGAFMGAAMTKVVAIRKTNSADRGKKLLFWYSIVAIGAFILNFGLAAVN